MKDYEKAFAEYCDLITDDYEIVNAEKCLVRNTYDEESEEETLTISEMVQTVKEELNKYYDEDFCVSDLYYKDRKEWQREVNELQAFIDKWGKPNKSTKPAKDKYKVVCTVCGEYWLYKRSGSVVKQYKECNCPHCKKKTLDLVVL